MFILQRKTFVLQLHTLLSPYSQTHSWIFQCFNRSWHTVHSTQANAQLDITKQISSRDETSRRVSSLRVDIRTDVDLSRVESDLAGRRRPETDPSALFHRYRVTCEKLRARFAPPKTIPGDRACRLSASNVTALDDKCLHQLGREKQM